MSVSSDRDKSNICNHQSILGTFGDFFLPALSRSSSQDLGSVHGLIAPSNVLLVDSQPAASCGSFSVDICVVLVVGTAGRILSIPSLDYISV